MVKKPKKSAKAAEPELTAPDKGTEPARDSDTPLPSPTAGIEDPLGEPADGEARVYLGDEDTPEALEFATTEPSAGESTAELEEVKSEAAGEAQTPAKLERLQKILSQAGVASRRRAEELITEGRVQVNGTVVTELGSKADAARDHIRVDGKLLHGAERHRYFLLNKPKGYVTTVSDPEGRPTVMTFFEKMRERLYPVGRLDYMSEGLLLVTNDGELANLLTKAGSGVEKTYLVKIAGEPSEDELDKLRGGVAIDRGEPGSGKVHTAPARIRKVRQGDNPWYEVVLIEGRNRELRKMFSSIDHFVEKIRRVGYGPLILDLEPGKVRELSQDELAKLRLAAEGKWHAPRPKEPKRSERSRTEFARPSRPARARPSGRSSEPRANDRPTRERFDRGERSSESRRPEFRPKRTFGADGRAKGGERNQRSESRRPFGGSTASSGGRSERGSFRPRNEHGGGNQTGRFGDRTFKGKPGGGKFAGRPSSGDGRNERPRTSEPRPERAGRASARGQSGFKGRSASGADRREFDTQRFDKPRSPRPPRREFDKPARKPEWRAGERSRPRGESAAGRSFGERGADRGAERGSKRPAPRPGVKPFKPSERSNNRSENAGENRSLSRPPSRGFSKPGARGGFQNRGGGGGARRGGPQAGRGPRTGGPRSGGPRPGGKRRP